MSKKHERLAYRLADILIRLNVGERLDINELAQTYKVSTRTLKRDFKNRLTVLDFYEQGPRFYSLNPKKTGDLAVADVRRFANFASVQDLLPEIDRHFFQQQLKQSVLVKGFAYEDISQYKSEFEDITTTITHCQYIEFDYQKVTALAATTSPSIRHHRLAPYQLINQNGIWYLIGTQKDKTLTFCFTQIHNLEVTAATFERSAQVEAQIKENDSLFFGNQVTEIIVQVEAEVAGYFERRDLLPNQSLLHKLDNGDLILSSCNVHPKEVIPIVRYWIPHIRIISPVALQYQMEETIFNYLKKSDAKKTND